MRGDISIPSGAIKRREKEFGACRFHAFQFLLVRLRVSTAFTAMTGPIFQFLLVRLRVMHAVEELLPSNISIPSGAIKRKATEATEEQVQDFNSFWCD